MLREINLEDKKFKESFESWINESEITPNQKYERQIAYIKINDVYINNKITLDLSRSKLTSLPEAIGNLTSLQNLDLSYCDNIKTLPPLPKDLKTLNLMGCNNLTTLPPLPEGLTTLDLTFCNSLETLPPLPEGLTTLDLTFCNSLETLPHLPEGLTTLDLSYCNSLETLPPIHNGFTILNLTGCKKLTTLPPLHNDFTTLNFELCDKLSLESIAKIVTLKEAKKNNPHSRIILPQHAYLRIFDTIKEKYKEYYLSNPNLSEKKFGVNDEKNYPFLFLLNRISGDSILRDKEKVLSWSIILVNKITKKPEILEFLDQKSKHYLSRLNQPVGALMEINDLMGITEKALKELLEKELLINIIKPGHLDPNSEEFKRRTTELDKKIKELISCEDQTQYECRIGLTLMTDPVKIQNGGNYFYERAAIEKWIDERGSDPFKIADSVRKENLEPQLKLKTEINNFIKKHIDALIESIYLGDYSLEMVEKIKTFIGDDSKFIEKVKEIRMRPPFLEPNSTYANTLNPMRLGQSGQNVALPDPAVDQKKSPRSSPKFHFVACIGREGREIS